MDDEGASEEIIADLCSRDSHRVWAASWRVLRSRDDTLFAALAASLDPIRAATEDLPLGGSLHSNAITLNAMFARVDHRRRGTCWCRSYSDLLLFDPAREQTAGYVRIDGASAPGWSMTYDVTCTVCGRRYAVEQGEYHYPWWKWVPFGDDRTDAPPHR